MDDRQPGDPDRAGPYRLVRRLGSGGMGRVFLGQSPGGRLLAVKVIRPELAADEQFRARFAREVAAARTVSGLFTAQVVDADPAAPLPWLATAYVPGPSLAEAVVEYGPLPELSVQALAVALAEGLGAIHAAGLVHRDLKPTNVLLAPDGPRIIDFGISRAAEASALTGTGLVVGSPGFMSPEQASGSEIGQASDIFSLGGVLAFAATGEGPFGSGSVPALLYRVVHNSPAISDVSGPARSLIARCLAKDPAERPSTRQILDELGPPGPPPEWLPATAYARYLAPADLTADTPAAWADAGGHGTELAARPAQYAAAAGPTTATAMPQAHVPQPLARRQPAAAADLATVPPGVPPGGRRSSRAAWAIAALLAAAVLAGAAFVLEKGGLTVASSPPRNQAARPPATSSRSSAPSSPPSSSATPTSSPASRTAHPSPSARAAALIVPQVTSDTTYQKGQLVYFRIYYSDPGHDAKGFGFVGADGAGWAEENHPFTSPSYGIVGPGRVDYPFNLACGTSQQYQSDVQAWIYDTAGTRSKPVTIHLACATFQVPQITSYTTYQKGQLVYFRIYYSDPGHDAKGFGFVGADGAGWAEENHPFTSPSYGIVGPGRVDYPFNLACGTSQQYQSAVKAWIYDTAGTRSQPVTIQLACTS